jgi:hypothetical protein
MGVGQSQHLGWGNKINKKIKKKIKLEAKLKK